MSEAKNVVVSIRLSPAVMKALTERAAQNRQPVRRMAALIIEDALRVADGDSLVREPRRGETVSLSHGRGKATSVVKVSGAGSARLLQERPTDFPKVEGPRFKASQKAAQDKVKP